MASTQTMKSEKPALIYWVVVTGCIAHALAFGISPFFHILDTYAARFWLPCLYFWPIWVLPLWLCRGGCMSRFMVPLVVGLSALLPGFYMLYILIYDFHPG
jgi:hypothetical protein